MRKTLVMLALVFASAAAPAFAECTPPARAGVSATCEPPAQRLAPGLQIEVGKMVYGTSGAIAPVYRLTSAGNPLLLIDGRPVIVPAETLTMAGNRLTTTLTRAQLRRMVKP